MDAARTGDERVIDAYVVVTPDHDTNDILSPAIRNSDSAAYSLIACGG
jgi:hypothetical protein